MHVYVRDERSTANKNDNKSSAIDFNEQAGVNQDYCE